MTHNDTKNSLKSGSIDFDDAPLFAGLEDGFWPVPLPDQEASESKVDECLAEKKKTKRSFKKSLPEAAAVNPQKKQTCKDIKTRPAALFLSVADLCSLLSISRATLVRMDKNDAVPGRIKLGGSVRYHRETIEKWLADLVDNK